MATNLVQNIFVPIANCSNQELQHAVANTRYKLPATVRALLRVEELPKHERQMLIDWLDACDFKSLEVQKHSDGVTPAYCAASKQEPGSPAYTQVEVKHRGRNLVLCFKPHSESRIDVWVKGNRHYVCLSQTQTTSWWSTAQGTRTEVPKGSWMAFKGVHPFDTQFEGLVAQNATGAKELYEDIIDTVLAWH